jgi:hypothetical protein
MTRPPAMRSSSLARSRGTERQVSLSEVLDRVLTKGAVVAGEVVISLAGVDLVYLGINVVLTSVDTALKSKVPAGCIDVNR